MEEHIVEIEREESIYDRIEGLKAEVNQMERMIEENIRLIAEGDDVEGRTFLKQHLEERVAESKEEIKKLQEQIDVEVK